MNKNYHKQNHRILFDKYYKMILFITLSHKLVTRCTHNDSEYSTTFVINSFCSYQLTFIITFNNNYIKTTFHFLLRVSVLSIFYYIYLQKYALYRLLIVYSFISDSRIAFERKKMLDETTKLKHIRFDQFH